MHRKGSNAIWTSAVFLARSCHRVLDDWVISPFIYRFADAIHSVWLRLFLRNRNAAGLQCVVIVVKVLQTL